MMKLSAAGLVLILGMMVALPASSLDGGAPAPHVPVGPDLKIPIAPAEASCATAKTIMETEGYHWSCVEHMIEKAGSSTTITEIAKAMDGSGGGYEITFHSVGYNPPCKSPNGGGYASCGFLQITLRAGAEIAEVHYFHLSRGDGVWHWNTPDFDLMYMLMEPAFVANGPDGSVFVTGHMRNWSHNQNMHAAMGVRWR